MSRRLVHVLMSLSLLLGTGALVAATAGSAQAIGAPVMIDDFSGHLGGTRTVTPLPDGNSTTAPGTFAESGGLATITADGNGNSAGGMILSYAMSNVDLTSQGNNTQFFLEFGSIQRLPVQTLGETAASITIQVTDSNGVTGVYNTGIANVIGFNVVLNFNCSPGQSACFSPQPNFTSVNKVQVEIRYPRNIDPVGSLTAVLDTIRTTPTGGIAPSAPSPQVTAPSSPVYGLIGDKVTFDVAFTSTTGPAAVTNNPPSSTGLRAQDIVTRGTAGGRNNVVVTGGPATYQVTLGPLTSTGTLGIDIPAEVVTDAWGSDNVASSNTPTVNFLIAVPPALDTANPPSFVIGESGSFQFEATGLPAPTFEAVGALPAGLSLDSDGTLSGTPEPGTRGNKSVTVRATNVAGSDTHTYAFAINELPMLNAPATVPFEVGTANSFTVTFDGFPLPSLGAPDRPAWLTRTNNGNGSVTFSGTPPVSAVGDTTMRLNASNAAGAAQQDVVLSVSPADTSLGLTVTPNPAVYGEASTATATVTADIAVTGDVTFEVDGDEVGTVPLSGGEVTSPTLTGAGGSVLGAGDHTVTATFVPDNAGAVGSTESTTLVVEKASTSTEVKVLPGTLRATVASDAGTPTGTVSFLVGPDEVGQATLVNGVAELAYTVPTGAAVEVAAHYEGDDNFTESSGSTNRQDPTIEATVTSRQPETRFGWYGTPVTVSFTCVEGSAPLTAPCPDPVKLTKSDADAVVERTITSEDGGIATAVEQVQLDLDKPKVRIKGVRDGATYAGKPPKPSCVATDRLSGIAKCKVTKQKNGTKVRVRAVATDKAGNTATARVSYRTASSFVRGAELRNGFYVVDAGRSYALVTRANKAPRYFFATPWPQKPYERGPLLDRRGDDRWVIRISVTDDMAARKKWNVGLKYGGKLHVVHLKIS